MDTLLVDQNDFKNYSNISQNIDTQQLRSSMLTSQMVQIQPCLGVDLYSELMTQKSTNTLTPLNNTLLEYIAPTIVYYTLYDILPTFYARMENKGISTNNETTQSSVDINMIKYLRGEHQIKGDQFKTRLIQYLEDNKSSYPLYISTTNCGCDDGDCKPRNQGVHFYKSNK